MNQKAFLPEILHERVMVKQTKTVAEVSMTSQTMLEKDVLLEIEQEEEQSKETESTEEELIFDDMPQNWTDVKKMALTKVDEVSVSSSDCHVRSCLSLEVVLKKASRSETDQVQMTEVLDTKETFTVPEQRSDSFQEHTLVQQDLKISCMQPLVDHMFRQVTGKKEQQKCVKTWKFKFKIKTASQMVRRQWVQLKVKPSFKGLRDVHVAPVYLVQVQRLSDVTLLTSEQQYCEPKKKYCKSWHFKYKPEEVERKRQDNHVLCSAYLVNHGGDFMRMAEIGWSLRFWKSPLQCLGL